MLRCNFETQRQLGCNVVWLEPDALQHKSPSMNVADLGAAVLMGFRNKAKALAEKLADRISGRPALPPSAAPYYRAAERKAAMPPCEH